MWGGWGRVREGAGDGGGGCGRVWGGWGRVRGTAGEGVGGCGGAGGGWGRVREGAGDGGGGCGRVWGAWGRVREGVGGAGGGWGRVREGAGGGRGRVWEGLGGLEEGEGGLGRVRGRVGEGVGGCGREGSGGVDPVVAHHPELLGPWAYPPVRGRITVVPPFHRALPGHPHPDRRFCAQGSRVRTARALAQCTTSRVQKFPLINGRSFQPLFSFGWAHPVPSERSGDRSTSSARSTHEGPTRTPDRRNSAVHYIPDLPHIHSVSATPDGIIMASVSQVRDLR